MTTYLEGQGLFGKITFTDGTEPPYERPYLIVAVEDNYVEVLNISSLAGKERKLAFASNKRIYKFNPPFIKPSFVKLDSLTRVPYDELEQLRILSGGATLDEEELSNIKKLLY